MGNTAPPHWVVTRGKSWLVHRPPCNYLVTRKGSMLSVLLVRILKQGSEYLVTTKMIAAAVTPESGLVQEELLMTPTHVETKLHGSQTTEIKTPKPWDIFWCSNEKDTKLLNKLPWSLSNVRYRCSFGHKIIKHNYDITTWKSIK